MTRVPGITALTLLAMLITTGAAQAQSGTSPPPGTNSAGTAQSSGSALNRGRGVTTGSARMGSGHATADPSMSPEAAINAENNTIDRKLKGICRGC